jgi:hypothetical protein
MKHEVQVDFQIDDINEWYSCQSINWRLFINMLHD